MVIKSINARDGALCGFFSCGSTNRLEGYGGSNLAPLGVGWEEWLFHLYFRVVVPVSSSMFLFRVGWFILRSRNAAIHIK